ncbi:M10 family metallopeptidase C-terminal domain-containing protein [Shinella sp.]|uniref:M10 family metallopeptidase C-terminal domain-containing protein n=1 Tax=Shinella sp. TaxID=1870904 RepID=UPI0029BD6B0D|nr:hypothetical protein [Shinella sp.]MDX3976130.1 hypothetical protein [Shinella sp.]
MTFDNKSIQIDYWFYNYGSNTIDTVHKWGMAFPGSGWGLKRVGLGEEITTAETQSPSLSPKGWETNPTGGIFSMDFTGNAINIKFYDTGLFTLYAPNGPYILDVNDELPKIAGFRLDTNMHWLERSDITTTTESILIDWRGGSFTKSTYVNLEILFANEIDGNAKANVLKGGKTIDYITGGKGADVLTGGADADLFIFRKGDTGKTKKSADLITDFSVKDGDKIDLHLWDANSKRPGTQDFDFIGKEKFSKQAGELRYEKSGKETLLTGDTNGDGKADFLIRFKGTIDFYHDLFEF